MSTLADLLNAPSTVTYKGKAYPLRDLTYTERAMVSRRLEQRAEEALARAFGRMPQAAWDARSKSLDAAIAAGEYEYGGVAYMHAMTTIYGMSYVLHVALKDGHPEVTEEFAQTMVAEMVGEKLYRQLQQIAEAGQEPGNSSAPGGSSPPRGTCSKSSRTSRSRKRRKK